MTECGQRIGAGGGAGNRPVKYRARVLTLARDRFGYEPWRCDYDYEHEQEHEVEE
jgi:hypothetical protein